MENIHIELALEENLRDTIQYLYYMKESYSEIIKDIIENKRCINSNKELLDYYNEQYLDYNLKLKALQEEVVYDLYPIESGQSAIYYVDFHRSKIIITGFKSIIR